MAHSTLPQMARRAGRLLLAAIFLAGSVSTTWGGLSGGVVFSPETAIAAPAPQSDGGAANSAFVPTVRYEHEDRIFGGLWTTGIQVMNLDPANEAAVELGFYDEWGAQPDGSARTEMVPAGKSRTFFADGLGVPAGFNGSAALKASRPIGVIVNQLAPGRGLAASFNAPAAGASKVYVPSIERGLGGYDSSLYIQNAGSGWIGTIKIEFFKLDEAQPVHTREYKARLAPGAAWELPQGGIPELATNFEGSAVVSADQPVAVVVNHSNRRSLLATVGQTTGAATLNAPLVMTNNGGFSSVVHVENVGETVTNVTITVVDSTTGAVVGTETRTLTPATTTKWGPLPGTERAGNAPFVGSATITASTGGLLVGAVEQYNPGTNQSSEYTLFAGGSADVVAPLVQTGNSGWSSGFQVMNVGTTPATVTVRVTSTEGLAVESVPNPTRTIAPGRSETWFPITAPDVRVVGSAVAEGSAGSQLVGVVNQLNTTATTADLFMTYEALNR